MDTGHEQPKETPSLGDAPVPLAVPAPPQLPVQPRFTAPVPGTSIISPLTGNTYRIFQEIGQGNFGIVFACSDTWNNDLAAKVFKPRNLPYEVVQGEAAAEFMKLMQLRHPNIISVFEAGGSYAAGKIDDAELKEVEKTSIPGPGSCAGMYTANTMASAIEALGMTLPYSSSTPAEDPLKIKECFLLYSKNYSNKN